MNGYGRLAKLTVIGLEEYSKMIAKMGERAQGIAKAAIYAGAEVIADAIRENLKSNLNATKSVSAHPTAQTKKHKMNTSTGDLSSSLGIAPIQAFGGDMNTKIGFDGYDHNGVANTLKARVMESGSSRIKKRPFVRPAVTKNKQKAIQVMGETIEKEIQKYIR